MRKVMALRKQKHIDRKPAKFQGASGYLRIFHGVYEYDRSGYCGEF